MSNDIYTVDLLRSLPDVLKNDDTMKSLAQTIGTQLQITVADIEQNIIYAHIDQLSEEVLDILAYDFKVDWWDYEYTLDEKRKMLKDSWNVHRHLGTKSAVETAISAIYPDTQVQEWFEYAGDPYCFKLLIDATYEHVDPAKHQRVLNRVDFYKNLRSHLDGVEYVAQPYGTCTSYMTASAASEEIEITVEVAVYGVG